MKTLWVGALALGMAGHASADLASDMVGTWEWEGYVIEATVCEATIVCALVIEGSQNVGMQMLKTTPIEDKGAWKAEVYHPATGALYFTKLTYNGSDAWTLAGCTKAGVCAEGVFTRK